MAVVIAGLVGRLRADGRLTGCCARVARLRHESYLTEYLAEILEGPPRHALSPRPPRGPSPDPAAIEIFLGHLADTLAAAGVSPGLADDVVQAVGRVRGDLTWNEIFG